VLGLGGVSAQAATRVGGQDIRDRAFSFSCGVVDFCKELHEAGGMARVLAPQLATSATAVSAMLEEARAAESRRDFISKSGIALKEIRESHVRLQICEKSSLGPPDRAKALCAEANELVAILTVIVRNAQQNLALKRGASKRRSAGPKSYSDV
jgi:four helix bundle protein